MTHELRITFPSKQLKEAFATFLIGGGDQLFTESLRVNGYRGVLRFGYHGPEDTRYAHDDARRYGAFLCDDTIRVEKVRSDA